MSLLRKDNQRPNACKYARRVSKVPPIKEDSTGETNSNKTQL
jgi:hypothetical protein